MDELDKKEAPNLNEEFYEDEDDDEIEEDDDDYFSDEDGKEVIHGQSRVPNSQVNIWLFKSKKNEKI